MTSILHCLLPWSDNPENMSCWKKLIFWLCADLFLSIFNLWLFVFKIIRKNLYLDFSVGNFGYSVFNSLYMSFYELTFFTKMCYLLFVVSFSSYHETWGIFNNSNFQKCYLFFHFTKNYKKSVQNSCTFRLTTRYILLFNVIYVHRWLLSFSGLYVQFFVCYHFI